MPKSPGGIQYEIHDNLQQDFGHSVIDINTGKSHLTVLVRKVVISGQAKYVTVAAEPSSAHPDDITAYLDYCFDSLMAEMADQGWLAVDAAGEK